MIGTKAPPMLDQTAVLAMRARWNRVALASIRQGLADELEAVQAGGPGAITPTLWVPILLAYWRGAVYQAYNYTTATLVDALKGAKVGTLRNLDSDILAVVTDKADFMAEHAADALAFGVDPDDWAELYDGWGDGFAEGVARTDSTGAVGLGQSNAAQAFPLLKTWLASFVNTRPTHATAHGQTIPVTDFYTVGGAALEYPGDPGGPASEVFNCQCWENYAKVS